MRPPRTSRMPSCATTTSSRSSARRALDSGTNHEPSARRMASWLLPSTDTVRSVTDTGVSSAVCRRRSTRPAGAGPASRVTSADCETGVSGPGALSEARSGAARSSGPQRWAYGRYAEQFSGSAFTAPRHANRRSWLYRIRRAAVHDSFRRIDDGRIPSRFDEPAPSPNPLRWSPPPLPSEPTDFIAALATLGGNGSPEQQLGCGIHWYAANRSMSERFFYDADGELLLVPQQGALRLATELGVLEVQPLEIAVMPRGLRFRVELPQSAARGYVCENFGAPFRLPELGPIGSNGLANPRDFQTPVAWYEDREGEFELVAKFAGHLWS